ncbi:MAG: hypothetical protein ACJARS_005007, partial [bacterium]
MRSVARGHGTARRVIEIAADGTAPACRRRVSSHPSPAPQRPGRPARLQDSGDDGEPSPIDEVIGWHAWDDVPSSRELNDTKTAAVRGE